MPESSSSRSTRTDERRPQGRRLEAFVRSRWLSRTGIRGLSEQVGVSRATLYSWFNGDSAPDTSQLAALADALGCSPAELVTVMAETTQSAISPASLMDPQVEAVADRAVARYQDQLSLEVDRLVGYEARQWESGASLVRRMALPSARIQQPVTAPPLVDLLEGRTVETCQVTDAIGTVQRTMYERNYSQLPVYDGDRLVDLLTTDTVARWHVGRDASASDEKSTVGEVLGFAETGPTYRLLGPNATAVDALDLFNSAVDAGLRLDGILVTSTGGPSGRPLAIATPADRRQLVARRSGEGS